jgi:tRNA pseudouridine55 synthase
VSTPGPDGLVLIDKPGGITSHDAVGRVRRALCTKKVGHAGTLDPMATGLLVMGVGRGTRLLRFLGDLPKTYEGVIRLGVETTTLDAEGDVTATRPVDGAGDADVAAAMASLVGEQEQRPPAFSAVKVGGRKLYEAARKGETLEAAARPIRVDRFDLVGRAAADVSFVATVSGGTYVRVLAADVGRALGCGAHLAMLRRTAIGPFDVAAARPPDDPGDVLPLERAVAHLPRFDVEREEAIAVSHGRILAPGDLEGPYGVYGPDGRLLGVYVDEGAKAKPLVILAPAGGRGSVEDA